MMEALLMSGGFYIPKTTSGLIFRTDKEVEMYQGLSVPDSLEDAFYTWPRFSGATYYATVAEIPAESQSNDWVYDSNLKSFVQPTNTSKMEGIVSPIKVDSYVFDTTVTSANADDDWIGIVLACDVVNGKNSALIATIAALSGRLDIKTILADGTMPTIASKVIGASYSNAASGDGWSGKTVRLLAVRSGNKISVKSSTWNSNVILDANEIIVDLSQIAGIPALTAPARYGFCTLSQAGSTYKNVSFTSNLYADTTKMYSQQTNTKWEYINDAWVKSANPAVSDFTDFDAVRNLKTIENFTINENSISFESNFGISYGTYDVTADPYSIVQIPTTGVAQSFTYEDPLNFLGVTDDGGYEVVDNGAMLDVTFGNSETGFYVNIGTSATFDPITNIPTQVIGFRRVVIDTPPALSVNMFETDVELDVFKSMNSPQTPLDIFNTWPRSQNQTYFSDPANATGDAAAWTYDANTNTFIQPINGLNYLMIHSPVAISNYTLETTLASSDPDGDLIGIVGASQYVNGELKTLAFIAQTGGRQHMKAFSAMLIDDTSSGLNHKLTATEIAGNNFLEQDPTATTASNTVPEYGWWNRTLKIKVERTGNMITAVISDWNGAVYEEASRLTVDLSTLPNGGSVLAGPSSYGFFTHSQGDSKYIGIQFESPDVSDDRVMYSLESNKKHSFSNGTWSETVGYAGDFTAIDLAINERTKEVFDTTGAISLKKSVGISDVEGSVSVPPNATTPVTVSSIISQFTFSEAVLGIDYAGNGSNLTATLNGANIDLTTTTGNGHFYVYLKSADYVDPYTKQTTSTIAVRKINVTVI